MIYKYLIKVPVFGGILRVINSYAFHGDYRSDQEFAPLMMWLKTFFAPVCLAILLTFVSSNNLHDFLDHSLPCIFKFPKINDSISPSDLILASFPSLLGFGIGVYALIFALSTKFLKSVEDTLKNSIQEGRRKSGSVLMLNSELAFPLLVLIITISLSAFGKIYPNKLIIIDIVWFSFWFSMIAIIELVQTLFSIGENELLIKVAAQKKDDDKKDDDKKD